MQKLIIKPRSQRANVFNKSHQWSVPGVVYGPDVKSSAILIGNHELRDAISNPGEVYNVTHQDKDFVVKIAEIQRNPVSGEIRHVSLVQLPKGQKAEVDVPVNLVGTPVGVQKGGTLVVLKDDITLEAKPKNVPKELTKSVSHLKVGESLTVGDVMENFSIDHSCDQTEVVAICKPPVVVEEKIMPDLQMANSL